MEAFIQNLIIIALPTILGYLLVTILTHKGPLSFLENLAVGYGIGLGILTQWMLWLSILKIPLIYPFIYYPLIIGILILLYVRHKHFLSNKTYEKPKFQFKFDFAVIIFSAYILGILAFIFWRSLNIPLFSWDAFSCNGFKAKAIFFEQSLDLLHNMPHYEYPLHVPFIQVWSSVILGIWHDQYIKIFFPFYILSLSIIMFYFLKRYTSIRWSLFGVVLLLSSNLTVFHATISYRDITLTYYITVSLMLLIMWKKDASNGRLYLASLLAGMATFVKLEAAGYLLVLTIILILILYEKNSFKINQKIKYFFVFCIPSYCILMIYNIYKILIVIPKIPTTEAEKLSFDLMSLKLKINLELFMKFLVVLNRVGYNIFISGNWNIVWLLFLIALLGSLKKNLAAETRILLISFVVFLGLQIAGYTLTQYYHWIANTHTSLSRHFIHHFPILALLVVMLNAQKEEE